jgi:hypothetical protein
MARLEPATASVDALAAPDVSGATSLALAAGAEDVFLAHGGGISRVHLSTRAVSSLPAPSAVSLARFLRLRAHRNGLVGLQDDGDGSAHLVHLALSPGGRAVRSATVFATRIDTTRGPVEIAVTGDEVTLGGVPPAVLGGEDASSPPGAFVLRRLRLP